MADKEKDGDALTDERRAKILTLTIQAAMNADMVQVMLDGVEMQTLDTFLDKSEAYKVADTVTANLSDESIKQLESAIRDAGSLIIRQSGEAGEIGSFLCNVTEDIEKDPYSRQAYDLFIGMDRGLSKAADYISLYSLALPEDQEKANQNTGGGAARLELIVPIIRRDIRTLEADLQAGNIAVPKEVQDNGGTLKGMTLEDQYKILYTLKKRKRTKKETAEAKARALEQGALMSLGGHVTALSSKELQTAFTGLRLYKLPESISTQNKNLFHEQTGLLIWEALGDDQLETFTEAHTAFFAAIFRAVELSTDLNKNEIEISLKGLLDDLGIDVRPYSSKRINTAEIELENLRVDKAMELIIPFERYVGETPNSSFYRVLTFNGYDRETKTIKINVPYFFELKRLAYRKDPKKDPALNSLFHSSIGNEPNHAAVELAFRIGAGILQRGTHGANEYGVVTYEPTYRLLIDDCPQVKAELDEILSGSAKNKNQLYNSKLKNLFETAFRLIETKSDFPTKYIDFKLPKKKMTTYSHKKDPKTGKYEKKLKERYITPTRSTLNSKLHITHKGRNK